MERIKLRLNVDLTVTDLATLGAALRRYALDCRTLAREHRKLKMSHSAANFAQYATDADTLLVKLESNRNFALADARK